MGRQAVQAAYVGGNGMLSDSAELSIQQMGRYGWNFALARSCLMYRSAFTRNVHDALN